MKEFPYDCDTTFFNTTNFHRFHVHLLKLFLPQLNNPIDSDSNFNSLLLHLISQNRPLDTFYELNNTDAEKLKNEVIDVFTQTDFDNSSETEFSLE